LKKTGELDALGAIMLWALFATLVRHVGQTPPLLLTGIALCCGSLASVHRWRDWRVPPATFAFGAGCLFVYHAALVAAFGLAPIAQANLINYLWPILLVLLGARRPGGALQPVQLAGCAAAFLGCVVAIAPSAASFDPRHLAGYALAALAALTWAWYSLGPRCMAPFSAWATGGFCAGAGVAALLAHALFEAPYRPAAAELLSIAAIGIGPLGLSFVLWNRAMRHGSASRIGSLCYLTPILSTGALGVAGAIDPGAWWRLLPALALVIAGARLAR